MGELKISELNYVPSGLSLNALEIPIDNGQQTYRITVEDFNEGGTASAQRYAANAATSAANALAYAGNASDSATDALNYRDSAVSAREAAESAASLASDYCDEALNARNDAVAAKNTINTAAATVAADVAIIEAAAESVAADRGLAQTAASNAASSASDADESARDSSSSALTSEAWATGTEDGVPVSEYDDQYHNNSKYYAEQAAGSASSASDSAYAAASSASAAATYTAKAPYIGANGKWFVWDATNNQYVDTNIDATGPTGNGIVSTTKTSTSGKVDTYTILYTNGTTDTFTVTNGEDGQGSGDMLMTDYDHDQDVFNSGGIPAYVTAQITSNNTNVVTPGLNGKMAKDGSNAASSVEFNSNVTVGSRSSSWAGNPYNTFTQGSGVQASGDYSSANGYKVIALGHISKAEGRNDSNNSKHVYLINGLLSEALEASEVVSIREWDSFKSDTRVVFTVEGTQIYDGTFSAMNQFTYSSNAYYTVRLIKSGSYLSLTLTALQTTTTETINVKLEVYMPVNAIGEGSHTEGFDTIAGGYYSHAEGCCTEAGVDYQHVSGKYNDNKAGTLFEVGNGTADNARSNAFEVYGDGFISQNNGTDKYKFAKSGGLDGFYDGSGNFHPFEPLYLEQSVTLSTSADTTVTFTNAAIATTSRIDCYTSEYGINPTNVVATAGSCTVTFKKASTASTITVGIEVKN